MAGPFYNKTLEQLSNDHSKVRGRMAEAMTNVNPQKLNQARNEDRDLKARVGAISDQRAYGSGCDFNPRGHRPLERGGHNEVYAGKYQNTNRSPVYPNASDTGKANRATPPWANDQKPRFDHSGSDAGRRRK